MRKSSKQLAVLLKPYYERPWQQTRCQIAEQQSQKKRQPFQAEIVNNTLTNDTYHSENGLLQLTFLSTDHDRAAWEKNSTKYRANNCSEEEKKVTEPNVPAKS